MECCGTKNNEGCCNDLKKDKMKGGNLKVKKRTILWVVIGIIFLFVLYFVFQAGSGISASDAGSAASSAAGAASNAMVGGC